MMQAIHDPTSDSQWKIPHAWVLMRRTSVIISTTASSTEIQKGCKEILCRLHYGSRRRMRKLASQSLRRPPSSVMGMVGLEFRVEWMRWESTFWKMLEESKCPLPGPSFCCMIFTFIYYTIQSRHSGASGNSPTGKVWKS